MNKHWTYYPDNCDNCGNDVEVYTEVGNDEGTVYDGDPVRCVECDTAGYVSVGDVDDVRIEWGEQEYRKVAPVRGFDCKRSGSIDGGGVMAEQTIPAEILDAAIRAIVDLRSQIPLSLCTGVDIAQVALRAAGVAALLARIAELEAALSELLNIAERMRNIPGVTVSSPVFWKAAMLLQEAQGGARG